MGRQRRDTKLDRVYFDPERVGSYGGVDALHRAIGEFPKRSAKRWLSEQDAYTLYKPVRRRLRLARRSRRSKPAVAGRSRRSNESEKKYDHGTEFLLMIIEFFWKRAWCVP